MKYDDCSTWKPAIGYTNKELIVLGCGNVLEVHAAKAPHKLPIRIDINTKIRVLLIQPRIDNANYASAAKDELLFLNGCFKLPRVRIGDERQKKDCYC